MFMCLYIISGVSLAAEFHFNSIPFNSTLINSDKTQETVSVFVFVQTSFIAEDVIYFREHSTDAQEESVFCSCLMETPVDIYVIY